MSTSTNIPYITEKVSVDWNKSDYFSSFEHFKGEQEFLKEINNQCCQSIRQRFLEMAYDLSPNVESDLSSLFTVSYSEEAMAIFDYVDEKDGVIYLRFNGTVS